MPEREAIAPSDKRVIQTLLSALQPFSILREHHAALRTVTTFLTVANNEARALGDYAIWQPRVGLPRFDVSVHWFWRFENEPGNMWLRSKIVDIFGERQ